MGCKHAPASDEWIRKYLATARRDRTRTLVPYETLLAVVEQLMEQKMELTKQRDLAMAFQVWDGDRAEHDTGTPRLLITADSKGFHLRHVRIVEHNLTDDEKLYHCDKPLGSCQRLDDLPALMIRAIQSIRAERSEVSKPE